MVSFFAASEGVPVSAEHLFNILGYPVTNSMVMGALVGVLIIVLFVLAAKRSTLHPVSRFAYFMESTIEFVTGQIADSFLHDQKKIRKFAPLFITFFIFILFNNLFGLLPGMGGTLYVQTGEGIKQALFRSFTTDLNGTLALATITMATVQFYAIRTRGVGGYIKHFFSVVTPLWISMNLFLGLIEIISEVTRLLTLALRLFGVIYAGEVLLHVIAHLTGNFSWLGTVPILLMEIFFASLQAYLFIMLSSVYLQMGTAHDEEAQESEPESPTASEAKWEAGASRV